MRYLRGIRAGRSRSRYFALLGFVGLVLTSNRAAGAGARFNPAFAVVPEAREISGAARIQPPEKEDPFQADRLMKAGKYAEALPLLTAELERKPASPDVLLNRAICYGQIGELAKAVGDADAYIRLRPDDLEGYHAKALCLTMMKPPQNQRAIDAYTTFLKRKPGHALGHYHRGMVYYMMFEYGKAYLDFKEASKDPTLAEAKGMLENAEDMVGSRGHPDRTERGITRLIAARPKDGQLYLRRGSLRVALAASMNGDDSRRKVKLMEAVSDLTEAARLLPDSWQVFYHRASAYLYLSEWDKVIADANTTIAKEKGREEGYLLRGRGNREKKLYKEAAADFETAFNLGRKGYAANYAGEMYLYLGRALKDSDTEQAHSALGNAVRMFERAISLTADSAVHYNLGITQSDLAQLQEYRATPSDPRPYAQAAIRAYERYLELEPDAKDRTEVRKIIDWLKEKWGM